MADFPCTFIEPPGVHLLPPADPINYEAVIMPFTNIVTAPPSITNISPPPGSLDSDEPISFRLTDDLGLYSLRELWVGFGDANSYDLAYDAEEDVDSFLGSYSASSTITPVTNGWDISIFRDGGWPSGLSVKLRVTVLDAEGHMVVINA